MSPEQVPPLDPLWCDPHPEVELTAADRALATSLRTQYVALRQAGFTENQALALLGNFLGTVFRGNS